MTSIRNSIRVGGSGTQFNLPSSMDKSGSWGQWTLLTLGDDLPWEVIKHGTVHWQETDFAAQIFANILPTSPIFEVNWPR